MRELEKLLEFNNILYEKLPNSIIIENDRGDKVGVRYDVEDKMYYMLIKYYNEEIPSGYKGSNVSSVLKIIKELLNN